ncbi:MAG: hypothetical protein ABIA47_01160 [bacterium]
MSAPFNRNGGLTLLPMPGFEPLAEQVKTEVELRGRRDDEKETPVDIVTPKFGLRASGEPFLRLGKSHVGEHDCVVLTSGPGTYEMLGQLYFLLSYLAGRRAERISVVSGYFPLSRSDKDEGSTEFALPPLIVRLMMSAADGKLDRVIAVDLHAPQVVMSGRQGMITEVSLVRRIVLKAMTDALGLGYKIVLGRPDEGGKKRYKNPLSRICGELNINPPMVNGDKERDDSRNSRVAGVFGDVDKVEGSVVIVIDDEVSTGGTIEHFAQSLKRDYGAAQVWCVATHGVLCDVAPSRFMNPLCAVNRMYVTDTIPAHNRPALDPLISSGILHEVPWAKDLAWIVYRHHWGMDIRTLR